MMEAVAGVINAAPTPSKTDHPTNNMFALMLKAAMTVPIPKITAPDMNAFFLPTTSCILLPKSIKEAKVRA